MLMAHIKITRFARAHSLLVVPLVVILLAKFILTAAENDIALRNDIKRRFLPDDEVANGNDVNSERHRFDEDGEDPTICGSMDLRNNLQSLEVLRPCRVIEGSLQILLIDNVNKTELEQISFPDLVEITDFFLLFRVNGLRSVGQLFPNLAVIRGNNLFMSTKALIIFQMSKLEEIGLYSLTHIVQGSVHVDKNPSLCYLNTIDWKRIIRDKTAFYGRSFKPENECPVCLDSAGGKACPRDPSVGNNYYCWNNAHCQKTCDEGCDSCNNRGKCCDSSCLGGCSDDNVKNCVMCKDYEIGRDENGFLICAEKCPKGYLSYYNRRCITENQCKLMVLSPHAPPPVFIEDVVKFPYKIFNETCTLSCPANYANDYDRHICEKCNTTCRKNCPGASIDSINLARKFKGCTHITSSLEIQIRGGNKVVKELEENLHMIEEIDGYLKIVRSFSLVSLDFLKNLKRIGGKHLENGKYSLIILDNQNLLDMWDWTNRTLKIDRGTLFFHFNPKLCYSKIQNLINITNINRIKEGKDPMVITDLEVAHNSNGDKIACDVVELKVNVSKIEKVVVLLEWHPFKLDDNRKLLGYTVYHIVAPNRTVNFYDGRDACGQDNWHVDDVRSNPDVPLVQHLLTNLQEFTQYAFYIRTYTIASENRGAQSKITYFTTKPSQPAQLNMKVRINSSDSFYLTWSEPPRANGKLTHYVVTGKKHPNLLLDNGRDYCKNPTKDFEEPKLIKDIYTPIKNDTCPTINKDDSEGNSIMSSYEEYENDEWNRIRFENALHDFVYVKRQTKVRRRRDSYEMHDKYSNMTQMHNRNNFLPNAFPSFKREDEMEENDKTENKTENGTNIWEQFRFIVHERELLIKNLHHFTFYEVSVQACREPIPEDQSESDYCSKADVRTVNTWKKSGADNITSMDIVNKTLNSVTVTWTNPIDPNGRVVSVIIKYKREDTENAQPNQECISIKDFKKYRTSETSMRYTINIRYPGNYSLCLKSTSLAGDGEYQICKYFVIDEQPNYAVLITISVLLFLFLAVAAAAYWMYRKTLKERELARRIKIDINMDYASLYEPDDWEVPRKKIELVKELGQGSFGMVWEGMAHDVQGLPFIRCAVKTVNEHATDRERSEFLKEASVMKAFDTTHVVKLLGVVSQGQPTLVIMELMTKGDLKTYLRSLRPDVHSCDHRNAISAKVENQKPPTLKQILQMAIEIADGMAYLESKKYVHRDLAARNCMVAEDLTVKIGDFGMTRDIYETDYYRKGTKGLLPVRWMAPESLKDGVFSSNSDVWSYGVVLWEMATLASQPYQGLSNDQVLRYVIDGGVMERPENCPDKLYTFMRFCWQPQSSLRPSFMRICQLMLQDAKPTFSKVSFYHSIAGNEARKVAKLQAPPSPPHGSDPDVPNVDPSSPLRRIHGLHLGSSYTPSESQESDVMEIDHHHHFPPISEEPNANGYVGARMRNGAGFTANNHVPTTG